MSYLVRNSRDRFQVLILISLALYFWDIKANSIASDETAPDETPHSHLRLYCLLTGISSKNEIKTSSPKGNDAHLRALGRDIMHVLDTYKFKMDQINSKREKVKSSIF